MTGQTKTPVTVNQVSLTALYLPPVDSEPTSLPQHTPASERP